MKSLNRELHEEKIALLGIKLTKKPTWIPYNVAMSLLQSVYNDPTLWLSLGIKWKYFCIRFDARTDDMLIYAGTGDDGWETEYISVEEC